MAGAWPERRRSVLRPIRISDWRHPARSARRAGLLSYVLYSAHLPDHSTVRGLADTLRRYHSACPQLTAWPSIARLFSAPFSLWAYATFTQNIAAAQQGMFGADWFAFTWSLAIEEQSTWWCHS